MLNLKKVMETGLASTISLRAIGGGVKIVRANHERADPNCRSHLKGAWKWWRREPLVLTPFWRCGWCQPASGPASGTWLAWKNRNPTRSPACTPNGRTLERSRYVASQLSEIVAKETRVKQIVTLSCWWLSIIDGCPFAVFCSNRAHQIWAIIRLNNW